MARLNIKWETRTTVAPTAAATGEAKADENAGRRFAERPMLVYVTSDDNTDNYSRKLEDVVFRDERVGIGSKFFDCIKVTNGNAMQDRLLSAHGKRSPRLLFVTRDFKVVKVLEARNLSGGKTVRAMASLTRSQYKDSFDRLVSKYAKLLNELDRLEGKKGQIADNMKRAVGNKSKLKKIARDQVKYDKAMENWRKAEAKLLGFRLKELKKPKV